MKKIILLTLMFSSALFATTQNESRKLYLNKCASCHHENRTGLSGPPLIAETLDKLNDEKLAKIIKNGLPNTLMPPFKDLTDKEVSELLILVRQKSDAKWLKKEIENSFEKNTVQNAPLPHKDVLNLTTVVERGLSKIWMMENEKILDKFDFADVHGGIKYSRDYKRYFIPSRSGFVGKYEIGSGYVGKIRACISLRNITVSNDNKYIAASCLYPQQIVVMSQDDFKVKTILKLNGKISGIYSLINENSALFTYRDLPELGKLNFKTLKIKTHKISEPIEDFFIDPLDRFMIGSSRNGEKVNILDIETNKVLSDSAITGFPHLSSAAYWYDNGDFYFATFHIKSNFISVWKMYDWSLVKKIEVGGNGFFVKTHQKTPYLWVDNGSDELTLIDKKTFAIKKMVPYPGKKFTHTEFSKDGQIAYLSIFDKEGSLMLIDSITLKEITKFENSLPVGKYNVVNKEREFLPVNLGESVFMAKCWGCHHQESTAFGPSFVKIASTRAKEMIRTHLDDPKTNALNLGYKNPTMPNIPLSENEKDMVTAYVHSFKQKLEKMKMYNMADHTLTHPDRSVENCENYLTWKKLGYEAFTEDDKKKEDLYKQLCQ